MGESKNAAFSPATTKAVQENWDKLKDMFGETSEVGCNGTEVMAFYVKDATNSIPMQKSWEMFARENSFKDANGGQPIGDM